MLPEPPKKLKRASERPFPWRCRNCGKQEVVPRTIEYRAETRYDGRLYSFTIPDLEIPICQACGEKVFTELVDDQENNALRAHLHLLTPAQMREGIKRLGMSQKEVAERLGIAEATLSRWLNECQIQSRAMDNLLRAFFSFPQLRSALSGRLRTRRLGYRMRSRGSHGIARLIRPPFRGEGVVKVALVATVSAAVGERRDQQRLAGGNAAAGKRARRGPLTAAELSRILRKLRGATRSGGDLVASPMGRNTSKSALIGEPLPNETSQCESSRRRSQETCGTLSRSRSYSRETQGAGFLFGLRYHVMYADLLRDALLEAAIYGEARLGEKDDHGQRYVIELEVAGPTGTATVRSAWIVLRGEDFPRFLSCYVV